MYHTCSYYESVYILDVNLMIATIKFLVYNMVIFHRISYCFMYVDLKSLSDVNSITQLTEFSI